MRVEALLLHLVDVPIMVEAQAVVHLVALEAMNLVIMEGWRKSLSR